MTMPLHTVACDSGHPAPWGWGWIVLIQKWEPGMPCPKCGGGVRILGKWQPPKAKPDDEAWREYEVVYIACLDDGAPGGDLWTTQSYLPVLILCEAPPGSGDYSVW